MQADGVQLVARDGTVFEVEKGTLVLAGGIMAGLLQADLGFAESRSQRILWDIDAVLLSHAVRYLQSRRDGDGAPDAPLFQVPPALALDMMLVADFLDI